MGGRTDEPGTEGRMPQYVCMIKASLSVTAWRELHIRNLHSYDSSK